jgi:hypothetical protein
MAERAKANTQMFGSTSIEAPQRQWLIALKDHVALKHVAEPRRVGVGINSEQQRRQRALPRPPPVLHTSLWHQSRSL